MPINTLTGAASNWKAYDQWIQEDADKAAYTAASPENSLVLVGPSRKPEGSDLAGLYPVGMLQNFTIGQSINWQAQQMIGSARTFFLAAKAPGNGSITKLFTSQRTLLGALYQVVNEKVGSPALEEQAYQNDSKIMFTLDTELLRLPFGMAALFRDVTRRFIGGFYVEHMVIPNINLGFAVGQPAIFESVNVMFDRIVPFDVEGHLIGGSMETEFDNAMKSTT